MKQVILMRTDLGMKKGKMVAQGAHACAEACRRISPNHPWYFEGMPKIVLRVSFEELDRLIKDAISKGYLAGTICDAGKTTFTEPTITCGYIGPDTDENIDSLTNELKLL